MAARRPAALLFCSAIACYSKAPDIPLTIDAGQRLVLVAVRPNGELFPVPRLIANESIPLALEDGAAVVSWTFDASDLIDEQGVLLSKEALDRIEVDVDPGGACGRCLDPRVEKPRMIHGGSACPLPRSLSSTVVRGELSAEGLDLIRSKIFLRSPDPCACDDTIEPPPALTVKALAPTPNAEPIEQVVITPQGDIALLSERRVVWIRDDGTIINQDALLRGPISSAVALANGSVLIAAADPTGDAKTRYLRLDPAREPEVLAASVDLTPRDVVRDGDELIVFGRKLIAEPGQRALVQRCTLDTTLLCSGDVPAKFLGDDLRAEPPSSGARLASGRIVAVNEIGFVALGRPPAANSWRSWELTGDRIARNIKAAAAGERVFICASGGRGGRSDLWSVDFSTITSTSEQAALSAATRSITAPFAGECTGFVSTSPDRIRVYSADDRWREIDVSTASITAQGSTSEDFGLDVPIAVVRYTAGGYVAVSADGGVFKRGPRDPAFVHVFGPREHQPYLIGAIVARNGAFWAFSGLGEVQIIRDETIERRQIDDIPGEAGVAFLDDRDRIWLGGILPPPQISGWIRILDPERLTTERFESALLDDSQPSAFAQLAPGRVLIALANGDTIESSGTRPEFIDDDPATAGPDLEPPPDPNRCGIEQLRFGLHGGGISSAVASHGVAWGVGCGPRFFRFELSSTPIAKMVSLSLPAPEGSLLFTESGEPPASALAICPDRLLIATQGNTGGEEESGTIYELRSSRESDRPDGVIFEKSRVHRPVREGLGISGGAPIFLVGDRRSITQIANAHDRRSNIRRVGSEDTFRIDRSITAAAYDPISGDVLLGSTNGWIFLAE